jgi:hypothetical protein
LFIVPLVVPEPVVPEPVLPEPVLPLVWPYELLLLMPLFVPLFVPLYEPLLLVLPVVPMFADVSVVAAELMSVEVVLLPAV